MLKLSLDFCPEWEFGPAAFWVSSHFEIVKFCDSVARLAAWWGWWSEPWVVRNVSGLPGPSVAGQSVWINDPSPGRMSRGPDARHRASIKLYTLSFLSSEALQVGWCLIINILREAPKHEWAGRGERESLSRTLLMVGVEPPKPRHRHVADGHVNPANMLTLPGVCTMRKLHEDYYPHWTDGKLIVRGTPWAEDCPGTEKSGSKLILRLPSTRQQSLLGVFTPSLKG
jgi:hypothetical protein